MHAFPQAARLCFMPLFCCLLNFGSADLYEEQVWRSADGRDITATVTEIDPAAQTVKLKRSDGYTFTIEFSKFAEDDSQRLEKEAARIREKSADSPADKGSTSSTEVVELPDKFECDDVPMVVQKGSYCVPASAAMIAGFHGIDTDQDQIAFLSSAGSFSNQGTVPADMVLAMQKLGFDGKALYWENEQDFQSQVLPAIRDALVKQGPIYISFRPGVFGDSGHGCVIVGYHDRREYLIFHNPWGNVFEKDYEDVAKEARGIVIIQAPEPAPIASEAFIEKIKEIVPKFEGDIFQVATNLNRKGQPHELIWCSRRDARTDQRFAEDTARDDGRKILDLAFHRNPAVFIPKNNRDGETEKILFVTRPPEGGARFLVREIDETGWSEPELTTLGSLTRGWPTRFDGQKAGEFLWELPMIELHPED